MNATTTLDTSMTRLNATVDQYSKPLTGKTLAELLSLSFDVLLAVYAILTRLVAWSASNLNPTPRIKAWVEEQQDYSRYCREVGEAIDGAKSYPQSVPSGLTPVPFVVTEDMAERLVIRRPAAVKVSKPSVAKQPREMKAIRQTAKKSSKPTKNVKVSKAANAPVSSETTTAGIEVTSVKVSKGKYTRQGLELFSMALLRSIGNERGVKGRSKAELVERILAAQNAE